jgi:hypothetical protein
MSTYAPTPLNLPTLLARFCCEPVTLQELAAECGMEAPQFAWMLRHHAQRHGQTAAYEQAANRTHAADVARRSAEMAARETSRATQASQELALLAACEAWAEWLDHRRVCDHPAACALNVDQLVRAERLNRRALAAVGEVGG